MKYIILILMLAMTNELPKHKKKHKKEHIRKVPIFY